MFNFSLLDFNLMDGTVGAAEMLLHPFDHTFYIDVQSGWSGAECERILEEHGISIYAPNIVEGDILFSVSRDRAEEAERLSLRAGAPLKYHLFSERNRQYLR